MCWMWGGGGRRKSKWCVGHVCRGTGGAIGFSDLFAIVFQHLSSKSSLDFFSVLSSFDLIYPVFNFLLGFTGFYWVLVGFSRFYWVLLGFTGFY